MLGGWNSVATALDGALAAATTPRGSGERSRLVGSGARARCLHDFSHAAAGFALRAGEEVAVLSQPHPEWRRVRRQGPGGGPSEGLCPALYLGGLGQGRLPLPAGDALAVAKAPFRSAALELRPGDACEMVAPVDRRWVRVRRLAGGPLAEGFAPRCFLLTASDSSEPEPTYSTA